MNASPQLPLPPHFDPARVGEVWRVPYQTRAEEAPAWARRHGIRPAVEDPFRLCLVAVDVQNTFCIPGFELYVGGRSGSGAVDDNRRLCAFIYRNLGRITEICPTMDTHHAMQIFHPLYLLDPAGGHPPPYTLVSADSVRSGQWRFNPALAPALGIPVEEAQRQLLHYAETLEQSGKYALTVWPYHAMLGGIGHALVSAVEEAVFFHGVARASRPDFHIKGDNPFTEHYSVIGPEVLEGPGGAALARKSEKFVDMLLRFDAVVIAGQAKSHCVAWTIADLLRQAQARDARLARKVYLLEDCTSPVVVAGAIDYTEEADAAFRHFAKAGMHVVRSTLPLEDWPGIPTRHD
ncbi:MAG: isochorismatase [Thauera phenolivorans]|uniref:Isochorismatase n=1 Tax=Thauera phenolivorans TaxID=1792543 RepID=A0A7X7LYB9_9RHOO|nr:isochorismatase [Thauera phenolivorans]NLF55607.1 isochorismatase [Thauera phenolivorans]